MLEARLCVESKEPALETRRPCQVRSSEKEKMDVGDVGDVGSASGWEGVRAAMAAM